MGEFVSLYGHSCWIAPFASATPPEVKEGERNCGAFYAAKSHFSTIAAQAQGLHVHTWWKKEKGPVRRT